MESLVAAQPGRVAWSSPEKAGAYWHPTAQMLRRQPVKPPVPITAPFRPDNSDTLSAGK